MTILIDMMLNRLRILVGLNKSYIYIYMLFGKLVYLFVRYTHDIVILVLNYTIYQASKLGLRFFPPHHKLVTNLTPTLCFYSFDPPSLT